MGEEGNRTTNQVVLRAMDRTKEVILKLRESLKESERKGVVTPEIYNQLNKEILKIGRTLEKEQERIDALAETEPDYTEDLPEEFFECTEEELESYEIRISESDQSAA